MPGEWISDERRLTGTDVGDVLAWAEEQAAW
jgi:hypothetical protein